MWVFNVSKKFLMILANLEVIQFESISWIYRLKVAKPKLESIEYGGVKTLKTSTAPSIPTFLTAYPIKTISNNLNHLSFID